MSLTVDTPPQTQRGVVRRHASRWFHPDLAGVIAVIVGVVVANWSYLSGITNPNPLATVSGLGIITKPGILPGASTIDPNVGFTSQALGRLAGHLLIHGQSVWWNPFEALGMPLAGEMQSAALFPLTPLLVLPNGQVYFHVCLQLICGLATYFLIRRFAVAWPVAAAGAIAFACNGTFAWLANAVVNPIAFLPVIVLGIELARERSINARRGGWYLITAGVAFSLYAGFPEVAYLNALFISMWTIVRFATVERDSMARFAAKLGTGVLTGVLIAAPIIIAFADFLHVGTAGSHDASGLSSVNLPPIARPALLFPYIYGGIFAFNKVVPGLGTFWSSVGGFMTTTVLFFALIGVTGTRDRALRIALGAWAVFALCVTYGIGGAHSIFNLFPVIKSVATYRYLPVSWEFALVVLASFGLSDLCEKRTGWSRVVFATLFSGVCILMSLRGASATRHQLSEAGNIGHYASFQVLWPIAAVVVAALGAFVLRGRVRIVVLSCLLAFDAMIAFALPTLSAPRQFSLDTTPITFLQQHLGNQRFFTLGPILPNYGSFFGIASINANDLPVAKDFDTYVRTHLNSNQNGFLFLPGPRIFPHGQSGSDAFLTNMANYEAAGVKYVVSGPALGVTNWFRAMGLHVVFRDLVATIAALPTVTPYLSTGPNCSIVITSRSEATTYCTKPSTLTRLEMVLPGSSATLNGANAPITVVGDVFEQIRVPAGVSHVTFSYTPPAMWLAMWAFWLAIFFVLASMGLGLWRRVGTRSTGAKVPRPGSPRSPSPPARGARDLAAPFVVTDEPRPRYVPGLKR